MSLEKMFAAVEDLRTTATADSAFGEPNSVHGRILIPVAAVGRGFGMGFGEEAAREGEPEQTPAGGKGSGACGGGMSRPIAVIEVTPEETVLRPIVDETKVALAGLALTGWVLFWLAATVRAVFGGRRRAGSPR